MGEKGGRDHHSRIRKKRHGPEAVCWGKGEEPFGKKERGLMTKIGGIERGKIMNEREKKKIQLSQRGRALKGNLLGGRRWKAGNRS